MHVVSDAHVRYYSELRNILCHHHPVPMAKHILPICWWVKEFVVYQSALVSSEPI